MEERKSKINRFIRNGLKFMAYSVMAVMAVFRLIIPMVKQEPMYLDVNDKWVVLGCLSLLLSIEGVKKVIDAWVSKKR